MMIEAEVAYPLYTTQNRGHMFMAKLTKFPITLALSENRTNQQTLHFKPHPG